MTDEERPPVKVPEQRVGDVVPAGLWPDTPQSELRDVLDMEIVVKDVAFLMGDYGEFVVILYYMPDTGEEYSVACGGQVVVRKLHDCKKGGLLPLKAKIVKEERYYDIA